MSVSPVGRHAGAGAADPGPASGAAGAACAADPGDAPVFTDHDRIEPMSDTVHRLAADQRILVLSCRQRCSATWADRG
jgi:hypothetical protein